ncbi:low-complexity protein [Moraxella lacunata]|uniref:Low-complexity protein n=1 Tax=Moraxella lacunata TaxID=477 RepID=A0A1B8Q604_MORLA|nr:hypothetical protein [Moraxella lacunata]MDI4481828.1 low-complexity protein [Moraxella lacunata]OBX63913.1 hypothetical protein A9Z63_04415 [Moraxella lacunata]OBX65180.1 hypothetical protein A9309_02840 [Moraxella lacunata]
MSNLNRKITGLAVATLLATGLSACKEEKVQAQPLAQGYQNADTAQPNQAVVSDTKTAEGKCGEGKTAEGKCGEGKTAEGKCGEGKCGEGKCGATNADKSASASCGASTDKNANASCGGSK